MHNTISFLHQVRLYVLAIAFSLSFGALFSKTWRVHKIFTAQRAIKKKVGSIHFFSFSVFSVSFLFLFWGGGVVCFTWLVQVII